MSAEPQILILDGELAEDDVPSACASLDADVGSANLRPDLIAFAADVSQVRGVGEVDLVAGRAILVTARPAHIQHVAEYCIDYRPAGTTVVEPVSYSVLRHWTDAEEAFEEPEPDPVVAVRAQATFTRVTNELGEALTTTPAAFGAPRSHRVHGDLLQEWRHMDEVRLLIVEARVSPPEPRVSVQAVVCSRDGVDRFNDGLPDEDRLSVEHYTPADLEMVDDSQSWSITVVSPTWERLLVVAYQDLTQWIGTAMTPEHG